MSSLKFLENIDVYPCPDGEGNWELYIRTDTSDQPLGDRYSMGGVPPPLVYSFKKFDEAKEASEDWIDYLRKRKREMK